MRDHPRIRGEHESTMYCSPRDSGSSPHTRGARRPRLSASDPRRIIPAYAGSTDSEGTLLVSVRDHPRIRGEHGTAKKNSPNSNGSSPHTRGAHVHVRLRNDIARIIPAYAGSTRASAASFCHEADHPRIRGEHCPRGAGPVGVDGSSPHTRGAPSSSHTFVPHSGIIPAYAGSTSCAWGVSHFLADHPRIRGEHARVDELVAETLGSSPHTRGARRVAGLSSCRSRIIPAYAGSTLYFDKPQTRNCGSSPHTRGAPNDVGGAKCVERIIPAYAGSTLGAGQCRSSVADHPRIRGEHRDRVLLRRLGEGSSPHTRGALAGWQGCIARSRIIPAYAGSTPSGWLERILMSDHPRIRGEHTPRRLDMHIRERIIPAYAGSTGLCNLGPEAAPDHPRIRGEHPALGQWSRRETGSSPHTRGALRFRRMVLELVRIIPAYAGSTSLISLVMRICWDHPRIRGEHGRPECQSPQ